MWFIVAISSFFLISVTAITDKFLLTKSRLIPLNYAFTIGGLGSLAAVVLLLFVPTFHFPGAIWPQILLAGAGFYFGIYFMYQAIAKYEISKISPIINSLIPIFVWLLSFLVVFDQLALHQIFGCLIIIVTSYLISQVGRQKIRLPFKGLLLIGLSASMFGIYQIFNKFVYEADGFLNSFIWIRWSILMTAIVYTVFSGNLMNLLPKQRPKIKFKVTAKTQWLVLLVGQVSGAAATLLQQYAINLGNVVLVTALQGIQYFFILLFVLILTKKFPEIFKEGVSRRVISQKFIYSLFLVGGVVLVLIN